jgi:hypothetical protein
MWGHMAATDGQMDKILAFLDYEVVENEFIYTLTIIVCSHITPPRSLYLPIEIIVSRTQDIYSCAVLLSYC